jgi:hypothetical protein
MKHLIWMVLLSSWAGLGCVSTPKFWEKPKPQPAVQAAKPIPPVTAGQISEKNANQMAGALANEVSQDPCGTAIQQVGATTSEVTPCRH